MKFIYLILIIFLLFFYSCGGNTEVKCLKDKELVCACGDLSGIKTCEDDGKWSECICDVCQNIQCGENQVCNSETGVCELSCETVACGDGVCELNNNSLKCNCNEGFFDKNLKCTNISELCTDVVCGQGICDYQTGEAKCICNSGYHAEGLTCVENVSPCFDIFCSNNGNCIVDSETEAHCECNLGYVQSENKLDCIASCENINCSNQGICEIENNKPKCSCNLGYIADELTCVSKCENEVCDNHGTCELNTNGEPVCNCENGFKNEGNLNCVNVCQNITCNNHGNCEPDTNNNPVCNCDTGYGHGETEIECIYVCNNVNCQENAHCESDENSLPVCICNENYQDNNNDQICKPDCTNVQCGTNQVCSDLSGNAICICKENYQDNNFDGTCEKSCLLTTCENATCDDSTGLAVCLCDENYQDNDNNNICKPACSLNPNCGGFGICNDSTGTVNCLCQAGYQDNDNNGICEKACGMMTCGFYGSCEDESGQIICRCQAGYFVGSEGTCITPCEGITCNNHGSCVAQNATDAYCNCNNGYFQNGLSCVNPCENVNCNGYGDCTAINATDAFCTCDDGYQDNDENLSCIVSCDYANNCGENSNGCDDAGENILCDCKPNYQDNDCNGTCLESCSLVTCTEPNQTGQCDDSSGTAFCLLQPGYQWTQTIGGNWVDSANAITTDSLGNIYITGYFTGIVDFDFTSGVDTRESTTDNYGTFTKDIFVTKINSNGSYAWTYTAGSQGEDMGNDIEIDSNNNIYLIGHFSKSIKFDPNPNGNIYFNRGYEDFFVVKLTNNGQFGWAYSAGGTSYDSAKAITIDLQNNVYITGSFSNSVAFNPSTPSNFSVSNGYMDIFILKLNNLGVYSWHKTIGGTENDSGNGIAIDSNNNIYYAGIFASSVDFNFNSIETDIKTAVSYSDLFISKINSDLTYSSTITTGGIDSSITVQNFKIDLSNNLYVSGSFYGTVDFNPFTEVDNKINSGGDDGFLLKINSDSSYAFTKTISTSGSDSVQGICIRNGNIFITGYTGGQIKDFIVKKYDNTGLETFTKTIATANAEYGNDIVVNKYNDLYVTGVFNGVVDFNPETAVDEKTSSNNTGDIFIWKWY